MTNGERAERPACRTGRRILGYVDSEHAAIQTVGPVRGKSEHAVGAAAVQELANTIRVRGSGVDRGRVVHGGEEEWDPGAEDLRGDVLDDGDFRDPDRRGDLLVRVDAVIAQGRMGHPD